MTAEALAIVFSPNLLRAPQNDFVMILNNMGLSHKLVKALITHVREWFLIYFLKEKALNFFSLDSFTLFLTRLILRVMLLLMMMMSSILLF
jgi:hypothetical protein